MFRTGEELVFCTQFQVAKAARFMLAIWIQLKETLAQLDAEIRCNPFCDVHYNLSLASLWRFDVGDSGQRQFIVYERIVGRESCGKKTRARERVSIEAIGDDEGQRQSYKTRYTSVQSKLRRTDTIRY